MVIAFGNLLLTFPEEEFAPFRNWIKKCHARHAGAEEPDERSVILPATGERISMLLSPHELGAFVCMLDMADTEWQSQHIMSLLRGN
ncbi:hypothetical protein GCM10023143_16780 [Compostibacter hankyongensis]|uniref:Uncharacterized protein n=2 Tax=Compostibacter hankyongensis TaxID=1007089 RepID=A0ABP8FQM5_9BACT